MSKNRVVALLPMKAHSERVPEKNFRPLCGKPMFRWVLDKLLDVEDIDLIVINTDARAYLEPLGLIDEPRILIRDRKAELCGDFVSMNLILADDIAAVPADVYLMTHTTNPLISSDSIRKAIAAFNEGVRQHAADSLFSVTAYQTRFYRADGSPINHDPQNLVRTQDLEPWYEENSNLYIFSSKSFGATNARIGAAPILFETPKIESIDIDDWDDWRIAESLLSMSRITRDPGQITSV